MKKAYKDLTKNELLTVKAALEEIDYLPSEKKVEILYEDEYLLIVNKPKKIIIFPENFIFCPSFRFALPQGACPQRGRRALLLLSLCFPLRWVHHSG